MYSTCCPECGAGVKTATGNRRHDLMVLLLAGVLLAGFWGWAVMPDPAPGDHVVYPAHEYFPLMVEGWLQGRLDLPVPVADGLKVLPDPYDPEANRSFRYAANEVFTTSVTTAVGCTCTGGLLPPWWRFFRGDC